MKKDSPAPGFKFEQLLQTPGMRQAHLSDIRLLKVYMEKFAHDIPAEHRIVLQKFIASIDGPCPAAVEEEKSAA